ncbi:MAG: MinD/ParA family protein [Chloroflexi bacterium]|jgi:MinD-like ATPase involved in chromosome partitioning or flagellar assembly|nr:MinD/ParA family protein [Chloroflexota bacterium]
MSKIISIHSFRGGTGKSNTTANLAALLAAEGQRVGVIDTDIQSPGIHVLFGLTGASINHSLNDYLWGRCEIGQAAHDVTESLGAALKGKLYLIPSSIQADEIVNVLREGYDVSMLTNGFRKLIKELNLDILMIDTHPGLNEETLFSLAISHVLLIIMRPDQQDYEGTGVTIEVARSLDVPRLLLMVNKTPAAFPTAEVQARVEQTYGCEVAAVLPHSDEMMTLASNGIFALRFPEHPLTALYKEVALKLIA